MIEYNLTTA
jgi:DNA-binding GntR family transcriptional regulator